MTNRRLNRTPFLVTLLLTGVMASPLAFAGTQAQPNHNQFATTAVQSTGPVLGQGEDAVPPRNSQLKPNNIRSGESGGWTKAPQSRKLLVGHGQGDAPTHPRQPRLNVQSGDSDDAMATPQSRNPTVGHGQGAAPNR